MEAHTSVSSQVSDNSSGSNPRPAKKPRIELQDMKGHQFSSTSDFNPKASGWNKFKAEKWKKLYKQDMKPESKEFQFAGKEYMIRPFFLPLFETIMESVKQLDSVLIAGQPGTGKTVCLYYALAKLLYEEPDHPVLFVDRTDAILFWKREPYWMKATECHLALPQAAEEELDYRFPIFLDFDFKDGGKNAEPVKLLNVNLDNHVLIQAASPQPLNFTWTKIEVPQTIGIPQWTVSELIAGVEVWAKEGLYKTFRNNLKKALEGLTALPPVGSDDRSKVLLNQMKEHNVSEAISRVVLWIDEAMGRPRQAVDGNQGAVDNFDEYTDQEADDYPLVPAEEVVEARKTIREMLADATELSQISWNVIVTILVLAAMKWSGPCPRDIYEYIRNPSRLEKEIKQLFSPSLLTTMGESIYFLKYALITNSGDNPPDPVVHKVFFISALDSQGTKPGKDTFIENPDWELAFKSPKLEALAADALRMLHSNEIKDWYHIFEGNPSSSTQADRFYKRVSTCLLENIQGPIQLYLMQKQQNSTKFATDATPKLAMYTLPNTPNTHCTYQSFQHGCFKNKDTLSMNQYIFSKEPNTPLFNGILIQNQGGAHPVLWLIQFTTLLAPHRGSPKGYDLIDEISDIIKEKTKKQPTLRYVLLKPKWSISDSTAAWDMPPDGWKDQPDTSGSRKSHEGKVLFGWLDVPKAD